MKNRWPEITNEDVWRSYHIALARIARIARARGRVSVEYHVEQPFSEAPIEPVQTIDVRRVRFGQPPPRARLRAGDWVVVAYPRIRPCYVHFCRVGRSPSWSPLVAQLAAIAALRTSKTKRSALFDAAIGTDEVKRIYALRRFIARPALARRDRARLGRALRQARNDEDRSASERVLSAMLLSAMEGKPFDSNELAWLMALARAQNGDWSRVRPFAERMVEIGNASRVPSPGDGRSSVMVLGVYGAPDAERIRNVIRATSSTNGYRVVQRWAAAGVAPPDVDIATVTVACRSPDVPRIQLINEIIAGADLGELDYIVIVDPKAGLPDQFLDRFLDAQSALGFSIAQPVRSTGWYSDRLADHPREAMWSEIGAVVSIHRSMFGTMFPLQPHTILGWLEASSTNGCKRGIIDAASHAVAARNEVTTSSAPLPRTTGSAGQTAQRKAAIAETRALLDGQAAALGRPCYVLDWHSGLNLVETIRDHIAFSPAEAPPAALPYFGKSVELVALASSDGNDIREAERVARDAVLIRHGDGSVSVRRLSAAARPPGPSVSILIPTYNAAALVDECLAAMFPDLPTFLDVEILIIDDGSTDETATRVESWSRVDSRIRLLASKGANEGFVRACNRGAAAARGGMLVFLNNDTLPQPGWLHALLRTFAEHPEVGAVGGKLMYPDGRLQEAGSFIFSDGSAANFGRNAADSASPEFNYVREVDYCSAALLATPRELFTTLGGFDELYVPAYYEDTDYCMKVRAAGKRVYYQPASVVLHVEGASSGTNPELGAKRFQQLNEIKFRKKWREQLAGYGERPCSLDHTTLRALTCAHPPRRRALVCAPVLPEFDREGGSRRVFDHVDSLQAAGWAVVFVAENGDRTGRYGRVLEQLGVETHCGFDKLHELLAGGRFDAALIAFWYLAEKVIPRVRRWSPQTRILVDTIDLHFLRTGRQIAPWWDPRTSQSPENGHAHAMRRELAAYGAADAVLTVSTNEASLVSDLVAGSTPFVVRDCEDLERSTAPWSQRRGIVFLGNFRHPPNVDAVAYLCREVLPRVPASVRSRHPVYIVGNGLNDEVRSFAAGLRDVVMVGWVPSITTYLSFSRVMVAPLRHGAGTKRKLIQALLAGIPTVATSIACEGLPVRDGEQLLVADDAASFAECVVRLIDDDVLSETLADRGRASMEEWHSRPRSRDALIAAVDAVLATPSRERAESSTSAEPLEIYLANDV
jgi:GT2 family glycosyltransferase/glycosyltransferase involved in cell wall biosynthesis